VQWHAPVGAAPRRHHCGTAIVQADQRAGRVGAHLFAELGDQGRVHRHRHIDRQARQRLRRQQRTAVAARRDKGAVAVGQPDQLGVLRDLVAQPAFRITTAVIVLVVQQHQFEPVFIGDAGPAQHVDPALRMVAQGRALLGREGAGAMIEQGALAHHSHVHGQRGGREDHHFLGRFRQRPADQADDDGRFGAMANAVGAGNLIEEDGGQCDVRRARHGGNEFAREGAQVVVGVRSRMLAQGEQRAFEPRVQVIEALQHRDWLARVGVQAGGEPAIELTLLYYLSLGEEGVRRRWRGINVPGQRLPDGNVGKCDAPDGHGWCAYVCVAYSLARRAGARRRVSSGLAKQKRTIAATLISALSHCPNSDSSIEDFAL
jgi:hypothetical protein